MERADRDRLGVQAKEVRVLGVRAQVARVQVVRHLVPPLQAKAHPPLQLEAPQSKAQAYNLHTAEDDITVAAQRHHIVPGSPRPWALHRS